jgi:hypothetical protein
MKGKGHKRVREVEDEGAHAMGVRPLYLAAAVVWFREVHAVIKWPWQH